MSSNDSGSTDHYGELVDYIKRLHREGRTGVFYVKFRRLASLGTVKIALFQDGYSVIMINVHLDESFTPDVMIVDGDKEYPDAR